MRLGLLIGGGLLLAVFACRDREAPPADTLTAIDTPITADTAVPFPELPPWLRRLGPYVLVPGDTPSDAVVISLEPNPDSVRNPRVGEPVVLISAAGLPRSARVTGAPASDSGRCDVWPLAQLSAADRDPGPWSLGVVPGRAVPLPVDTLSGLPSRDSSALVGAIARAVSGLGGGTDPAFRGLPFVVRAAWRIRAPGAARIVVADIERRINQEADPRIERLAVVARETSPGRLAIGWQERVTGREETVPVTDLLAALEVSGVTALAVARLDDTGSVYLILERRADGTWITRWSSAERDC